MPYRQARWPPAAIGTATGFAPTASASPQAPGQPGAGFWHKRPYPLERNKAVAVHVLTWLLEDGDLSVVDRHIRPNYIQRNPQAPDGAQAIKDFARGIATQLPDMKYNVKRVLAEGDLVLVHSNPIFTTGSR